MAWAEQPIASSASRAWRRARERGGELLVLEEGAEDSRVPLVDQ